MLVRRAAMVVLAAALVAAGLQGPSARAASLSVVLQSGGSDAANRWVAVGAELGFSLRVSGGTPVSTRWRVDDTAVVAVTGQDDQATVTGRREGVTRLWVDVNGSDGVVVSDSCWVSVAVDVPDTPGAVVRKGAALYRSRTSQATSRGVLGANATATVLLVSGSWVRVVFADDFTFPADNDEPGRDAWVLTSSVDIPATSVTLDQEYLALPVGDSAELSASVKQSYANDYRLSWTSSSASVAEVDDGTVTGAGEGTATIAVKASSSHGATVTDTATVSAYTAVDEETFGVTTSRVDVRRAASASARAAGSLQAGADVEVAGVLATWVYVVSGDLDGFVPMSAVRIPVVDLRLDRASVTVKPGDAVTVGASVTPSLATDAALTWTSANPKIAAVDASGRVSGVKIGATTVRVVAGGIRASLAVTVSEDATADIAPVQEVPVDEILPTRALSLISTGAAKNTLRAYAWGVTTTKATYQLQHRLKNKAANKWTNAKVPAFSASGGMLKKLTAAFAKAWKGKTVQYRLVKTNAARKTVGSSNIVSVTNGKPSLSALPTSDITAKLTWTPMSGVKGYRVEGKNNKGKWVRISDITKASTTYSTVYQIDGRKLTPRSVYSFRVVACTKTSTGRCVKLTTPQGKALWSNTAKVTALDKKAERNARKLVKAMLTDRAGRVALYEKPGDLNRVAVQTSSGTTHPYVKFLWVADSGILEVHVYAEFVGRGREVGNSRSFAAMRAQAIRGIKAVWGGATIVGSRHDFGAVSFFRTKVVLHDRAKAKAEGHNYRQNYLKVRIGGNGRELELLYTDWKLQKHYTNCVEYWYSVCGPSDFGLSGKSTFIYLPWDAQAKAEVLRATPAELSLVVAHEFGHTMTLGDAYDATVYTKSVDQWRNQYVPDRMYENGETTNQGARYSNIMSQDYEYAERSGSSTEIVQPVALPNDFEMVLYSYANALAGRPKSQYYGEVSFCASGWSLQKDQLYCDYPGNKNWRTWSASCMIRDAHDERIIGPLRASHRRGEQECGN